MTGSGAWLDSRRPPPPADLRARLGETGGHAGDALVEHLLTEATAALDRARASPGRVRESALELLVADALFTYACEAALELPQPDAALGRIARAAAEKR